jgi:predicted PurR-regulated permease PerM
MNVPDTNIDKLRPLVSRRLVAARDGKEFRALAVTVGALALFVYFIRSILLPFVLAGIIAYICTPLLNWLARRTRLPRALFAVLLFLVLVGSVVLFIAVAGQRLVVETRDTLFDLQGTIDHIARQATGDQPVHLFGQSINPGDFGRTMSDRARDWFGQPDRVALLTGYGLAAIMGAFLTVALLCYFLIGGPSIARGLLWTVPPSQRTLVRQIAARVDPLLKRYYFGMFVIIVYAIAAAYIGLGVILGIRHAPLLAMLTGTLETVPIIGSTSAAILAGLVSLHTATGLGSIFAFALYVVVLRLSIDQIVAPLVLGAAGHVHPVLIIFCFFAGAILLGIPGVILAVPVALAAKTAIAILYADDAE